MSNPLDSGFQAGPTNPFQARPVAPLFVRDRHGSAESTSTFGDIEPKPIAEDDGANPWAGDQRAPAVKQSKEPELPPVDKGWKAWSILGGAFIMEALIWGFPLCSGVFQNYYYTVDGPFKSNTWLPFVGVTSTGIFFLGAPLMTYLTEILPRYRRQMIWVGWPLCIAALLAGSFATNLPVLIATQGIMYSMGSLILYLPLMSIINEWFIERRGLAFGIVTASTGLTGIALPLLTEVMLTRLGYQTTLRIYALIIAVVTGPMLLLLKPRLPSSMLPTTGTLDLSFLRTPLFYLYAISNTTHSFALFLPSLFLPQFASALNLSPTLGALLLSLLAIGQVLGQLCFGYLSDRSARTSSSRIRIPLNVLVFASSFLSAIAVLTLWGLASNMILLAIFSFVFGFFANGYVVLWARMGVILSSTTASSTPQNGTSRSSRHQPTTYSSSAVLATFSLFSFQKGLAILASGPISSALIGLGQSFAHSNLGGYGAGGRFAGVVAFTGMCMSLSALIVGSWYVLPRSWREKGLNRVKNTNPDKAKDLENDEEDDGFESAPPCSAAALASIEAAENVWGEKPPSEKVPDTPAWQERCDQWEESLKRQWVNEGEAPGKRREGSHGEIGDVRVAKPRGWLGSVDSDAAEVKEERWD